MPDAPRPAARADRHPGGAGGQRRRRWHRPVGHDHLRDAVGRRGARRWPPRPRRRPLLQPLRQPDRAARSRTPSPSSRAPRPAWRSARAWARSSASCSACARRATTSSPSASSSRRPSCSSRRAAPGSASTSPSSTAPTPAALRRRRAARARRSWCSSRRRPTRSSMLVDLDALGAIAGPDHGGRLHLRHAARPAAPRARRRPGGALGDQGRCRATTTPPSAWSPGEQSWSTGLALRRRARRHGVALRRRQRAAGHAHAGRAARATSRPPAHRLAERLESHPPVAAVHYPGLDSHPQHELAKRQMDLRRDCLSFEVAGGLEARRGSSTPSSWPAWRRRSAGPRRSSTTPPP